ncbi:MAG: endonuclease/exonuclease/phosphatase family protein [Clostridia bacterium]|nr:endonuclease/exonuclease/phosphatase family protein [Clostridia bacterium]
MKNKNIRSLTCLLLVLFMILVSVVGCGGDPVPIDPPSSGGGSGLVDLPDLEDEEEEEESSDTPESTERTTITFAEIANAKIVIPTGSMLIDDEGKGYVYSAICTMQLRMNSTHKINLPIVQDQQGSESEFEILIGETNREESTMVLGKELSLNDYGYAICGTKIVIRGGCDTALKQAITDFTNNVAGRKRSPVNFYERPLDTVTRGSYLAKNMKLNDVLLSDYAVVYPENSELYEQELAQRLTDRIQLLTGRRVDCYSDAHAYDASVREILVGKTNRPFTAVTQSGAAYEGDSKFIALVGTTSYDIGLAEVAFQKMIEEKVIAKVDDVEVTNAIAATPKETVSLMGYNINGTTAALYQERVDNLCRLMTKYLPDILVFQEPAKNMMDLIHMEDYYGYYLGIPRHGEDVPALSPNWMGANSYAPILYAKDRYEVVEGGTKWMTDTPDEVSKLGQSDYYRIYTFVLFRDKVTDEQFLVVNHHLDFDSAVQVQTMKYMFRYLNKAYTDVPVIMAGDFNATQSSTVIKDLIVGAAGFKSAHLLTANIDTDATSGDIDFIFVTDCCVSCKRFTMCRDTYPDIKSLAFDHKMPSDHPATYAELLISSKKQCTHNWGAAATFVSQTTPT